MMKVVQILRGKMTIGTVYPEDLYKYYGIKDEPLPELIERLNRQKIAEGKEERLQIVYKGENNI